MPSNYARTIALDLMRAKGIDETLCVGCGRLNGCGDARSSMDLGQSVRSCAMFVPMFDARYDACSRCVRRITTEKFDVCEFGGCTQRTRDFIMWFTTKKGLKKI